MFIGSKDTHLMKEANIRLPKIELIGCRFSSQNTPVTSDEEDSPIIQNLEHKMSLGLPFDDTPFETLL